VSVPPVRHARLWIQRALIRESRDQHSFDSFPGLIAVFHALHRLLAPRHPPHALSSLAALILSSVPRLAHAGAGAKRKQTEDRIQLPTHQIQSVGFVTILCFHRARAENSQETTT